MNDNHRGLGEVETQDGLLQRARRRHRRRPAVLTWTFCAASIIAFGIVIYFKTDVGTLKITVNDPDIQVSLDNESIRLVAKSKEWSLRAGAHRLEIRVDDALLPEGSRVVIEVDGQLRGPSVPIGKNDLKLERLEIVRGRTTSVVVSIERPFDSLRKEFHGQVVSFDEKTRRIVLEYDFEDQSQLKDWELVRPTASTAMSVRQGRLFFTQHENHVAYAIHSAKFTNVKITCEFSVVDAMRPGRGCVFILVNASRNLSFDFLQAAQDKKRVKSGGAEGAQLSVFESGVYDRVSHISPDRSPFHSYSDGIATVERLGQTVRAFFDVSDEPLLQKRGRDVPNGHVGMAAHRSSIDFDNVVIDGILDEGWYTKLKNGAKANPQGPQ